MYIKYKSIIFFFGNKIKYKNFKNQNIKNKAMKILTF